MLYKRLCTTVLVSLMALGLAGMASAKTFSLVAGSGAQMHIGGGLPLPVHLGAATSLQTGTVFPGLAVPVNPGGPKTVQGTTGTGLQITIPKGVLKHTAVQQTIGLFTSNPTLYAVATNLTFTWPFTNNVVLSKNAGPRGSIATSIVFPAPGVGTGATVRYSERVIGKRFGGAANFNVAAGAPAGKITFAPVTIYALAVPTAGAGNPPCHHPALNTTAGNGGIWPPPGNPACVAALIMAAPTGLQVAGGVPNGTLMTTPVNFVPGIQIGAFGTGILRPAGPPGSVSIVVPTPNSNPGPTNKNTESGFPFTTGMLTISAMSAKGAPEKFVISGGDTRSAGGNGVLQLVSGSLSTRTLSGPNANRQWVRLILADYSPPNLVPTMSPLMQAFTVGIIIAVTTAGGYAMRTRRNSA